MHGHCIRGHIRVGASRAACVPLMEAKRRAAGGRLAACRWWEMSGVPLVEGKRRAAGGRYAACRWWEISGVPLVGPNGFHWVPRGGHGGRGRRAYVAKVRTAANRGTYD